MISVRGDPSFVVKEGTRTVKKEQFWLPTSTAVPLLSWDSEVSRGPNPNPNPNPNPDPNPNPNPNPNQVTIAVRG